MKNKKNLKLCHPEGAKRPKDLKILRALHALRMTFMAFIIYSLMTSFLFADAQQIAVTAQTTVAPAGQYGPVISASDQTVQEGGTLDFEVLATDANAGDSVHLEILQGQPPWLTILSNTDGNPASMRLRAAPPMGAAGRYRVYFKATDNSPYNLTATKDIYINVNPANRPPVITAQNQTVQAGNTLTFTVDCQDPDSADTVTLSYTGKPGWLTASPSDNPAAGNPIDITFTGVPQISDQGIYTMAFTAVDNGTPQQNASKSITITVTGTNHPPVLQPIRNKEVSVRMKLEFKMNATDPDGDALSYSATGLPFSMGAAFNTSTGEFSWATTDSDAGNYPAHFEVSDGFLSASEDIIIYVAPNNAPIFDPFPYLSSPFVNMYGVRIRAGKTLRFAVTAKDPNNDPITYSVLNLPAGAEFDPLTQTLTWTPGAGQEGTYQVTFTASDGVNTTTKDLTIIVRPATAPELKPVGEKRVRAGQLLSFTLDATDPDTLLNQLTYSVSNNPPGSSLTGPNFTWTPTSAQVGTYRDIIFTVSDGASSDSSDCWIFVSANGAPVIDRIGEKHAVEARTLAFTVNATDPDGDPITYLQPTNAPKGSYFDPSTHIFTWTPAIGERGVYNDIIFSVTDGTYTTSDNVWIFVDANDAPVVDPLFEQHVKAGHTLSFGITAYDPNGDTLTYKALNLPSGAAFAGQTFRWTPALSQVGVYNDILFEVSDRVNVSTVRTWIFVEAPGAPVIDRVGEQYVTAGQTLTFIVHATDPDGDPLAYSASNLPQGAVFNSTTHTFTWTPVLSQVGTYPDVLFHVTDGMFTATDDCWIFVKGPGAPVITVPGVPGGLRVRAGSLLEFTVSATDSNTPPAQLTYTASNLPPGATFENQVFRWTPTADQIGTYPDVRFTVSDGAYSDSQVTWIFVRPVGAPQFDQDITYKIAKINQPLVFTASATDSDNTQAQLEYYGVNLPSGATFIDRTFRWTPTADQEGTYKNVMLEVRDPDNNMDSDLFWIYVVRNSPPALDFIGDKYGNIGQPMTFTVTATDADNDPLTFSASNLPAGASFNPLTQVFSWTPTQTGTSPNVHFEVSDGTAADSENISIIISP